MSKTIAAKVESKKVEEAKKAPEHSYAKWMALVILTILIFGFVGYKYLLDVADELKTKTFEKEAKQVFEKNAEPAVEAPSVAEEIDVVEAEIKPAIEEAIITEEEPVEVVEEVEEIASQTELFQQTEVAIDAAPKVDNEALEALLIKQDNTIIYLAAKALKASSGNEEFQENLDFLDASSKSSPTIQSKISLLRSVSYTHLTLPTKA